MTTTGLKLLVAYVVLTSLVLQQIDAARCASRKAFKAQVSNGLPPKSPPLLVHCMTDEGKCLGTQTVDVNTTYEMEVCERLFTRTKYSCSFQWGLKSQSFEVLDSKTSLAECANRVCFWSAQPDGLYFREGSGDLVKKFAWK